MKRLISVLLLLSLLTASCLFLGSCDRASEKDLEKDPTTALGTALDNASSSFFTDDADIGGIIADALKEGKLEISFDGGDIAEDVEVNETIYFNQKDKQYVSDTTVSFDGEEIFGRIFINDKGFAVSSEDLLGSDKTLLVDLSTIGDAFEDGFLGEMIDDDEIIDMLVELFDYTAEQYALAFSDDAEERNAQMNEMLALLRPTTTTEKIDINGDSVKCVIVTYTIDNDTIADLFEYSIELLPEMYLEEMGVSADDIDEMIDELNEVAEIDLTATVAINKKQNAIAKIDFGGTVEIEGTAIEADIEAVFSETAITMTAEIEGDEFAVAVTADLTKEETKEGVEYALELNVEYNDAEINLLNLTYTYEKSGDFTVEADIYNFEGGKDRYEATITGKVTSEKKSAEILIDSFALDLGGEEIEAEFELAFTFYKEAEIPEIPSDAIDIADMDEEDWAELIEEIEDGMLGALIGGGSTSLLEGTYAATVDGQLEIIDIFGGTSGDLCVEIGDTITWYTYELNDSMTEITLTYDGSESVPPMTLSFSYGDGYIVINGQTYTAYEYEY